MKEKLFQTLHLIDPTLLMEVSIPSLSIISFSEAQQGTNGNMFKLVCIQGVCL